MIRHRLLQRQIRKHLGEDPIVPAEIMNLLRSVEESYEQFDADRKLAERSMEISSKELMESNARLLAQNASTSAVLESLRDTMRGLGIATSTPAEGWDDILSLSNLIQEQIRLRNEAEARLSSNEQELRLIVETARDYAIITYDARGQVVRWNFGAEQLLGHSPADARGMRFDQTFIPTDRTDGIPGRLLDQAREDRNCSFQGMRAHRDGGEFWADSTLSFIEETPTGPQFVEITRDITFHKRAEEALRLAKESAEAAGRAKSEFLATMSHEIRTPMNGVVGFAHLLLETQLDAKQRQYTEIINRSGQSLLTIINDILDFSKIEAGKLTVESIPFSAATVVEDTIELLAQRAGEKKLELALSCDPSLPAELLGDPGRVRQILVNLVGNAIKFTQRGHILVEVGPPASLRQAHPDLPAELAGVPQALFCVTDTGIGIPLDKQPHLFQKFTQADSSTTRRFGGTGLGLAIAKRLAELMGGQMGFSSRQGLGSTFWFTLPLPRHTPPVRAVSPRPAIGRARVLLVDDNPEVLRLLADRFAAWEIPFVTAATADDALCAVARAVEHGAPLDLVLVDELSGHRDAHALASDLMDFPVQVRPKLILMTGGTGEIDVAALHALGFVAQLPKPVVRDRQLRSVLETAFCADPDHPPEPAVPPTPGSGSEAAPAPRVPADGARKRVLVAEDSPTNQQLALRILEEMGCAVDLAVNGREVVAMSSAGLYDLILMDCQMPDMDGFEATAAIRRREAGRTHVPIVAVTANAIQGDRERCLAAGMDGYLTKPIHPDALRDLVAGQAFPRSA